MLSRHGARYPTQGALVADFGEKVKRAGKRFRARGKLAFLNEWEYQLGEEILVPKGKFFLSFPFSLYESRAHSRSHSSADGLFVEQADRSSSTRESCIRTCILSCTTPTARSSSGPRYVFPFPFC